MSAFLVLEHLRLNQLVVHGAHVRLELVDLVLAEMAALVQFQLSLLIQRHIVLLELNLFAHLIHHTLHSELDQVADGSLFVRFGHLIFVLLIIVLGKNLLFPHHLPAVIEELEEVKLEALVTLVPISALKASVMGVVTNHGY